MSKKDEIHSVEFFYNGKKFYFNSENKKYKDFYKNVLDFLDVNYDFNGEKSDLMTYRRYSIKNNDDMLKKNEYSDNTWYSLGDYFYYVKLGNIAFKNYILYYLKDLGITNIIYKIGNNVVNAENVNNIDIDDIDDIDIDNVENKLKNAVCVYGDSGVGKSYRINKTLENENHNILTILPSSLGESLLYDYSPITEKYELSDFGYFLLRAYETPSAFYTIVFDEFQRYIDIINNDILQAISTTRNDKVRFISLPKTIRELYSDMHIDEKLRLLIPDNLGFIFITSKEDIVKGNDDIKNRTIFVELLKSYQENENYTIDELLKYKEQNINL